MYFKSEMVNNAAVLEVKNTKVFIVEVKVTTTKLAYDLLIWTFRVWGQKSIVNLSN